MLRLVLRTSPYMEARARFVLEALCTQYRLPLTDRADDASFTLYYGDPTGVTDDLAGREGGLLIPLAPTTEALFHDRRRFEPSGGVAWGKLRYLFGAGGEVEPRGRWQVLPVDPIASAFYFLSAYQEWFSEAADSHGRFPAEDMLQVQWGIERTPLVDAYFAALVQLLPASLNVTLAPLIGHAPFMVALSHDIDYLYRGHGSTPIIQGWQVIGWLRNWLAGKVSTERVGTALRGFSAYPNFNLDRIARLETEAGVRATYYLLPGYGVPECHRKNHIPASDWRYDEHQWLLKQYPGVDADYRLEDARVLRVIRRLEAQGMEIGLHSGYYSIMDGLLAEDITRLRQVAPAIAGIRAHYLRFRVKSLYRQLDGGAPGALASGADQLKGLADRSPTPTGHNVTAHNESVWLGLDSSTPIHGSPATRLRAASLQYDHSMGIPGRSGYRTGTAYPHRLFDHDRDKPFETLSIPLHFMEAWHMPNLKPGQEVEIAWEVLLPMLEAAHKAGSILSVLTHNWLFAESGMALYTRLLDYLRQHNGRGIAAGDLAGWWRMRQGQA